MVEESSAKPKLIYFNILGRGMKCRMLLKHAGIEFEEVAPGEGGYPEWKVMKENHPDLGGLPWYKDANGKIWNQSDAIMRAIANQAGYKTEDPWVQYEHDWLFETINDFNNTDGWGSPFFKGAEATQEMQDKSLDIIGKFFDKLQAKFASDGRAYGSGAKIGAADFVLLALDVRYWSNPNTKAPEHAAKVKELLDTRPAVKAVIEKIKGENGLQAYIDGWYAKGCTM